jgi:capsular polysaccharide transport system permease protein
MPDSVVNRDPRAQVSTGSDPAGGHTSAQERIDKVDRAIVSRARSGRELESKAPDSLQLSDQKLFSALHTLSSTNPPRARRGLWWGFLLCVILPTCLVAAYLYLVAANQYTAEFRFSVTETNPTLPGSSAPTSSSSAASTAAAAATAMSGLSGNMAGMLGSPGATSQNFIVVDYLKSQQLVDELDKRIDIRKLYSGKEAGWDWWAKFDRNLPLDQFLPYWNKVISAHFDPIIGVATVRVRAFAPEQALLIGNTLVSMAESLINEVAMRPMRDAIRYAEGEVKHAELRLERARAAVDEYRRSTGVVDPTGSISNNVALLQVLRGQLAQLQVQYQTASAQQLKPNAPALLQLSSRISATQAELRRVEGEVSKSSGGAAAIADLAGKFEQLELQRQYASAMVISSMQALDQARANAAAQHFYLTPFVRPSLPVTPSYPKRLQATLIAALSFVGLWVLGIMIVRSVKEHL